MFPTWFRAELQWSLGAAVPLALQLGFCTCRCCVLSEVTATLNPLAGRHKSGTFRAHPVTPTGSLQTLPVFFSALIAQG